MTSVSQKQLGRQALNYSHTYRNNIQHKKGPLHTCVCLSSSQHLWSYCNEATVFNRMRCKTTKEAGDRRVYFSQLSILVLTSHLSESETMFDN